MKSSNFTIKNSVFYIAAIILLIAVGVSLLVPRGFIHQTESNSVSAIETMREITKQQMVDREIERIKQMKSYNETIADAVKANDKLVRENKFIKASYEKERSKVRELNDHEQVNQFLFNTSCTESPILLYEDSNCPSDTSYVIPIDAIRMSNLFYIDMIETNRLFENEASKNIQLNHALDATSKQILLYQTKINDMTTDASMDSILMNQYKLSAEQNKKEAKHQKFVGIRNTAMATALGIMALVLFSR